MSKNPKPTTEELRCVYDLILRGYDDADILAEYAGLYENGNLTFPYRTDKRFIRERRKELAAAEAVLQEHVKRQVDPIIVQQRKEHFDHLAEIAKYLLVGDLEKLMPDSFSDGISDNYTIYSDEEEELDLEELGLRLDGNVEDAIHKYGPPDFWDNFVNHLETENHKIKSGQFFEIVVSNPFEVIDTIRIISQRKTFKGTCPVCEDW